MKGSAVRIRASALTKYLQSLPFERERPSSGASSNGGGNKALSSSASRRERERAARCRTARWVSWSCCRGLRCGDGGSGVLLGVDRGHVVRSPEHLLAVVGAWAVAVVGAIQVHGVGAGDD